VTYQTQKRSLESIFEDYAAFFPSSSGTSSGKRDFEKFVTQNTKEHQLIVVDQTQAKYDIKSTFSTDKAPDPTDPKNELVFKIGDNQFWREAGCKWEKQVKRAKNSPSGLEREDWEERAMARWKKDEEDEPDDDEGEEKLESNQLVFAPKEYRTALQQYWIKKLGKSHVQRAKEALGKHGKFVPGYKPMH
jgi:hypothetical protein